MFSWAGPCPGQAAWLGTRFQRLSKRAGDAFVLGDGSVRLEKKGWKQFLVGLGAANSLGTSSGQYALKHGEVTLWAGSQRPHAGQTDLGRSSSLPAVWNRFPRAFPSLLDLPYLLSVMPALSSIGCAVELPATPSRVLSWIFLGVECRRGEGCIIFSFGPL